MENILANNVLRLQINARSRLVVRHDMGTKYMIKNIGMVELRCNHCGKIAWCSAETTLYGVEWLCKGCAEENDAQQEQMRMRRNNRPCTCGSGEPWVSCGANSPYCG